MSEIVQFLLDCCEAFGVSPILAGSAALLVLAWLFVDFYEEHFQ